MENEERPGNELGEQPVIEAGAPEPEEPPVSEGETSHEEEPAAGETEETVPLEPPEQEPAQSDRPVRLLRNVLCALVFGCLLTVSALLLAGGGAPGMWAALRNSGAAVALTVLFFALAGLALGLALGRLVRGLVVVYVPVILLLVVNYFKEQITTTPLQLADLKLAGQVGDIAGLNAQALTVSGALVLALILPLAWCAAVWVFRKRFLDLDWKWNLAGAGGGLAAFLALFVLLADPVIYTPLGVPLSDGMSQAAVNVRTLVPLGLWRGLLFRDKTIEDYSPESMEQAGQSETEAAEEKEPSVWELIDVPEETPSEVRPNVILILSESFFDVTRLPGVTFEEDPLAEFHAVQAESVSGTFYTRALGYGTCGIELEVLTGLNDRLLPYGEDLIHYAPEQLAVFPTLPSLFHNNGYHTTFFHIFDDSIYNRAELFSGLGFDEMYFITDIPSIDPMCVPDTNYWPYLDTRRSGYNYYYSDQYFAELLIDLYEQKTEGEPLFLYGISIENHSPYTADKYDQYDYPFTCEAELTEDALGSLSAYTQGVSDTAESLRILTDYFSQAEEPTIIVFYGDHRPGLGLEDGSTVYSQLGIYEPPLAAAALEVLTDLYSTDYLIWSNDPDLLPVPAGRRMDSSSNFLGTEVLRAANIEFPRYWRLVDMLSQESLAYTWAYFMGRDGVARAAMPDTVNEKPFTTMSYALHDAFHDQYMTGWLNDLPGTPLEEPESEPEGEQDQTDKIS